MREPEISRHCDDNYICEKYGLNRISLACRIKIDMRKCPRYKREGENIVEKEEWKNED